MKKPIFRILIMMLLAGFMFNLSGCASLKKKFTRKKKPKKKKIHYQLRKYDVKPSFDLYEKHYIFWGNWHTKLVEDLGENFKSDLRSCQEARANLGSMAALLVDEKQAELEVHVTQLKKVEVIIEKRNMTQANIMRIRRILETEFRAIKVPYTPSKMADYIREDWKEDTGTEKND